MTDAAVDEHLLLIDPGWLPDSDDDPPVDAVIGLWPRRDDGTLGPFRSNPDYRPVDDNSPTDPIEALIRVALAGDAEIDDLLTVLRDSTMEIALNGDGRPLILRADDGVRCVVVATSEPHRLRIASPDWRLVDAAELRALLPDGADVLVNPNSPVPARLAGEFVTTPEGSL
ncbi:type VII secretion system-associated protein [Winogradskya consettensis]|nr:type VII secretion system-associated protein [Actinoplanes consettensis]